MANKMKEYREKKGLSQEELAEISNIRLGNLINIDPSYISRFRSGLRSPGARRPASPA